MFKEITPGNLHPSIRAVIGAVNFHRVSCGIYDDCGYNFSNLIWERE